MLRLILSSFSFISLLIPAPAPSDRERVDWAVDSIQKDFKETKNKELMLVDMSFRLKELSKLMESYEVPTSSKIKGLEIFEQTLQQKFSVLNNNELRDFRITALSGIAAIAKGITTADSFDFRARVRKDLAKALGEPGYHSDGIDDQGRVLLQTEALNGLLPLVEKGQFNIMQMDKLIAIAKGLSSSTKSMGGISVAQILQTLQQSKARLQKEAKANRGDRNGQIHKLDDARKKRYADVELRFSPVVLQATTIEKVKDGTGNEAEKMDPADALVSPFFHGDDFTTNGEAIFQTKTNPRTGLIVSAYPLIAQVPALLIETKTHYYISYILYHAYDTKSDPPHSQDGEELWEVIRKVPGGAILGVLEYFVTNAHGYPEIYSPVHAFQEWLRWNFLKRLPTKKQAVMGNLFVKDRFALAHHSGDPEFIKGQNGEMHPILFSCAGSHSTYKGNPAKFIYEGCGDGCLYKGSSPQNENETLCYPLPQKNLRLFKYSIFNMDEYLISLYLRDAELPAGALDDLKRLRDKEFYGNQRNFSASVLDGHIKLDPRIPRSFVKGTNDGKPEADLPTEWSMQTDYTFSVSFLRDAYLDDSLEREISDVADFDPYILYDDL